MITVFACILTVFGVFSIMYAICLHAVSMAKYKFTAWWRAQKKQTLLFTAMLQSLSPDHSKIKL